MPEPIVMRRCDCCEMEVATRKCGNCDTMLWEHQWTQGGLCWLCHRKEYPAAHRTSIPQLSANISAERKATVTRHREACLMAMKRRRLAPGRVNLVRVKRAFRWIRLRAFWQRILFYLRGPDPRVTLEDD